MDRRWSSTIVLNYGSIVPGCPTRNVVKQVGRKKYELSSRLYLFY
jgi:hypothetical protein